MPNTKEMLVARPIRLWPGVVAAVLLIFFRSVLPAVAPNIDIGGMDATLMATLGGVLCALAILLWWFFFSRAPWPDRLISLGVIVLAIMLMRPLAHISIQNGFMNLMFYISAPLTVSLALVIWAVLSRRVSPGLRRVTMVAAILVGCGVWVMARTDGVYGGASALHWRWTPTAEDLLLAQGEEAPKPLPPTPTVSAALTAAPTAIPATPSATPAPATPAGAAMSESRTIAAGRVEWPGFRGPNRDGVAHGVHINTNWSASPPVQLWRRDIGPGWSSFAVSGDLLYTQEQRGDDELVACYRVSTGEPVWRHRDGVRFYESNGGAGPRGTPTIHDGRVYALGATGILNALDARTGAIVWSRNAARDTGRGLPGWGFTSSPLIIDDKVIVATSGTMAAFDVATGAPRWIGPRLLGSYSSPHRVTIDGVTQLLLLSGSGADSIDPATGTLLWENAWADGGVAIVQPAVIDGSDILITTSSAMGGLGVRRLHVTHGPDAATANGGWNVVERWTSNGLKPYFNDFVIHKGHAIGFDGSILASINLEDGKRDWKGGRYGNGQLLLLPDQDLLLVISEEGELALVSATPDKHTEIAKFPALDGKTWNHPVIVGDILLVRNGEHMAAFRLALTDR